jgi:hypothetical protein
MDFMLRRKITEARATDAPVLTSFTSRSHSSFVQPAIACYPLEGGSVLSVADPSRELRGIFNDRFSSYALTAVAETDRPRCAAMSAGRCF